MRENVTKMKGRNIWGKKGKTNVGKGETVQSRRGLFSRVAVQRGDSATRGRGREDGGKQTGGDAKENQLINRSQCEQATVHSLVGSFVRSFVEPERVQASMSE